MDPKASAQLDPKLQEAYDRVMSMQIETPANPQPAQTAPLAQQMPPSPVSQNTTMNTPNQPIQNPMPQVMPAPDEMVKTPSPLIDTVENNVSVKPQSFVAKGSGLQVSPVILVVGAVAFLIVYTVIWIKVFNLPVPYINQ